MWSSVFKMLLRKSDSDLGLARLRGRFLEKIAQRRHRDWGPEKFRIISAQTAREECAAKGFMVNVESTDPLTEAEFLRVTERMGIPGGFVQIECVGFRAELHRVISLEVPNYPRELLELGRQDVNHYLSLLYQVNELCHGFVDAIVHSGVQTALRLKDDAIRDDAIQLLPEIFRAMKRFPSASLVEALIQHFETLRAYEGRLLLAMEWGDLVFGDSLITDSFAKHFIKRFPHLAGGAKAVMVLEFCLGVKNNFLKQWGLCWHPAMQFAFDNIDFISAEQSRKSIYEALRSIQGTAVAFPAVFSTLPKHLSTLLDPKRNAAIARMSKQLVEWENDYHRDAKFLHCTTTVDLLGEVLNNIDTVMVPDNERLFLRICRKWFAKEFYLCRSLIDHFVPRLPLFHDERVQAVFEELVFNRLPPDDYDGHEYVYYDYGVLMAKHGLSRIAALSEAELQKPPIDLADTIQREIHETEFGGCFDLRRMRSLLRPGYALEEVATREQCNPHVWHALSMLKAAGWARDDLASVYSVLRKLGDSSEGSVAACKLMTLYLHEKHAQNAYAIPDLEAFVKNATTLASSVEMRRMTAAVLAGRKPTQVSTWSDLFTQLALKQDEIHRRAIPMPVTSWDKRNVRSEHREGSEGLKCFWMVRHADSLHRAIMTFAYESDMLFKTLYTFIDSGAKIVGLEGPPMELGHCNSFSSFVLAFDLLRNIRSQVVFCRMCALEPPRHQLGGDELLSLLEHAMTKNTKQFYGLGEWAWFAEELSSSGPDVRNYFDDFLDGAAEASGFLDTARPLLLSFHSTPDLYKRLVRHCRNTGHDFFRISHLFKATDSGVQKQYSTPKLPAALAACIENAARRGADPVSIRTFIDYCSSDRDKVSQAGGTMEMLLSAGVSPSAVPTCMQVLSLLEHDPGYACFLGRLFLRNEAKEGIPDAVKALFVRLYSENRADRHDWGIIEHLREANSVFKAIERNQEALSLLAAAVETPLCLAGILSVIKKAASIGRAITCSKDDSPDLADLMRHVVKQFLSCPQEWRTTDPSEIRDKLLGLRKVVNENTYARLLRSLLSWTGVPVPVNVSYLESVLLTASQFPVARTYVHAALTNSMPDGLDARFPRLYKLFLRDLQAQVNYREFGFRSKRPVSMTQFADALVAAIDCGEWSTSEVFVLVRTLQEERLHYAMNACISAREAARHTKDIEIIDRYLAAGGGEGADEGIIRSLTEPNPPKEPVSISEVSDVLRRHRLFISLGQQKIRDSLGRPKMQCGYSLLVNKMTEWLRDADLAVFRDRTSGSWFPLRGWKSRARRRRLTVLRYLEEYGPQDIPTVECVQEEQSNNPNFRLVLNLGIEGSITFFVKLFGTDRQREFESERDLTKAFAGSLQSRGIATALHVGSVDQPIGRYRCLVSTFIDGVPLKRVLEELHARRGGNGMVRSYARSARILALIHDESKTLPPFAKRIVSGENDLSANLKAKCHARLVAAGFDAGTYEKFRDLTSGMVRRLEKLAREDGVFVKGAHPNNWVLAGEDLVPVDFEGTRIGCSLLDLAFLLEYGIYTPHSDYTSPPLSIKRRVLHTYWRAREVNRCHSIHELELAYPLAAVYAHLSFIGSCVRDLHSNPADFSAMLAKLSYHVDNIKLLASSVDVGPALSQVLKAVDEWGLWKRWPRSK